MQVNAPKNQKTSGGFGDLYVNDWQENREKIGIGTLYLIFRHLQWSD